MTLADFQQWGLKEISSGQNYKNSVYLLFAEALIKDYSQVMHDDATAIKNIINNPAFCAAEGEAGIKALKGNQLKCELKRGKDNFQAEITHELKVRTSDNRIALVALKPLTAGPTLLIATHYIAGGFHNTKDRKKTYHATLDPIVRTSTPPQHNRQQFFAPPPVKPNQEAGLTHNSRVFAPR